MRAFVLEGPGGIEKLRMKEIDQPVIKGDEVLIKVKAISINPIDIKTRKGQGSYPRIKDQSPMILGWDLSGEVVAVGKEVSRFKIGDEVFGMINFPGHGRTYAEYTTAPESDLAFKPEEITHEEAAAASLAGLTAWQVLVNEAKITKGQRVLIYAAAGGVGHLAVQIAKHFGAYVIGTASAANREFLQQLGADEHIDYTKVKFEEATKDIDVVLDAVGGEVVSRSFAVLKKGGKIITIPSGMGEEWKPLAEKLRIDARSYLVHSSGQDMEHLAELLKTKALKPYISHQYTFEQIPEGQFQVETGKTRGKVVITVK